MLCKRLQIGPAPVRLAIGGRLDTSKKSRPLICKEQGRDSYVQRTVMI